MYSLLFRNKWLAATWAGMLLTGVYLTTPAEDEMPPGAKLARTRATGAFAERAGVPSAASIRKFEAEMERREAADAFNSDESLVDDTAPVADDGY